MSKLKYAEMLLPNERAVRRFPAVPAWENLEFGVLKKSTTDLRPGKAHL